MAPDVTLTVDHVTPVALGGSDDPTNLVAACQDCNAGKSSSAPDAPVVADVAQNAIRWKLAIDQAAAVMQRDEEAKQAAIRAVLDAWYDRWKMSRPGDEYPTLPADAETSIERWYTRGLPVPTMCRLVDVACSKYDRSRWDMKRPDVWPYYAGCCWRALTELAAKGKLKPRISHRFPLAQAAAAMQAVIDRKVIGKAVLVG